MRKRPRNIHVILLGAVGLYVAYLLGDAVFVKSWRDRLNSQKTFETKIETAKQNLDTETQRNKSLESRFQADWAQLGRRSHSVSLGAMPTELREWLWDLAEQAGLAEGRIPLKVLAPRFLPDRARAEVKAEYQPEGALEKVLKFLYLLYSSPRLGYVSRVVVKPMEQGEPEAPADGSAARPERSRSSPAARKDLYTVEIGYTAVWLDPAKGGKYEVAAKDADLPAVNRLAQVEAGGGWPAYAALAQNNNTMFRRFRVDRPPPPPPPPPPASRNDQGMPPPPPPPPSYRELAITGIYEGPSRSGQTLYATYYNSSTRASGRAKVGEPLADGVVAAIDPVGCYLVLKVEDQLFAVEMRQGRTLADRVPLEQYRPLQAFLRPLQAPQPGGPE